MLQRSEETQDTPASAVRGADPGDLIAGRYCVERVIGAGGMGVVLAAWDQSLERRVAIKILSDDGTDARRTARFSREAKALARISSEHVAAVFDSGTTKDGAPYLVMEFLSGPTLAAELRARSALPVTEAVGILLEVLEGLGAAHAVGVIHRDLKPSNVMLEERPNGKRIVKIVDFGIAKLASETTRAKAEMTTTNQYLGSPTYMSPEQARTPKDVDLRTDVWSAGVMLHELITGQPPFRGENIADLIATMLVEPPPALDDGRRDVPRGLSDVVRRCLRRDRDERYPSVHELAHALAPFGPSPTRVLDVVRTRAGRGRPAWLVVPVALALGAVVLAGWIRSRAHIAASGDETHAELIPATASSVGLDDSRREQPVDDTRREQPVDEAPEAGPTASPSAAIPAPPAAAPASTSAVAGAASRAQNRSTSVRKVPAVKPKPSNPRFTERD